MVQVAAQPPRSLLSARDVSTFVVIQSDNTVQAWNPDHMDNDVEQMKYNPTGSLVAMAESKGRDLPDLSLEDMQSVHDDITDDVYSVLTVENSVNSRKSYGGTAPDQVRAQIKRWKALV